MDCPRPNRPSEPRLQKVLAACGYGSRRACEALIASGRVTVDGERITAQGHRADPDRRAIRVDGRRVLPERFERLLLNKPRGILCTSRDPRGRRTFLDLLPPLGVRLVSAGRLDADSEGLLVVTNDGDLVQSLIHPSRGVAKTYRVELDRPLGPGERKRWEAGLRIGGTLHLAVSVRPWRGGGASEYRVVLRQGLNRQIRRMAEATGRRVLRLERTRLGPLALDGLAPGQWRRLTPGELRAIRDRPPGDAGEHPRE